MGLYLAVYLTYKVYPLIIFLRLNDKQLSGGEFIPDPTMLRNQLNFEFNLSIFASKYHYQDWDVPLNITKKTRPLVRVTICIIGQHYGHSLQQWLTGSETFSRGFEITKKKPNNKQVFLQSYQVLAFITCISKDITIFVITTITLIWLKITTGEMVEIP